MSYHDKIMNTPVSVTMSEIGLREQMLVYKDGHADALHAAAEIAVQADARIEELEIALQMIADGVFCDLSSVEEYAQKAI